MLDTEELRDAHTFRLGVLLLGEHTKFITY